MDQQRLITRLALAIATSRITGRGGMHALLTIALDDFSQVEVSFGATAAGSLRDAIIERLRQCLGPDDEIGIVDSDEFNVLVECADEPANAWEMAVLLLHELSAPFQLEGLAVGVTAYIGIALVQADHEVPADVARDAYAALYRAKLTGPTRWAMFDNGMHEAAIERFKLVADLRLAADRREFRLHYQPILDCRTGELVSLEALIRWEHPDRGCLAPSAFLDAVADAGLMPRVGFWVVGEALRQSVEWSDRAGLRVPIAINLSPRQLTDPGFATLVATLVRDMGAEASCITFELTEEIELGDGDTALAALRELRAAGFGVRIDDFGTGYSSLSYLQWLPIDGLKIDRAFIHHLERDFKRREIVAAIIRMAHALGLDVVAEGVERREQLEVLHALGCDKVQGFFLSPPLAAPDTLHWLKMRCQLDEKEVA